MGYPVGAQLNAKILNCHSDDISFRLDGTLIVGNNPDAGHIIPYIQYYNFCKATIRRGLELLASANPAGVAVYIFNLLFLPVHVRHHVGAVFTSLPRGRHTALRVNRTGDDGARLP